MKNGPIPQYRKPQCSPPRGNIHWMFCYIFRLKQSYSKNKQTETACGYPGPRGFLLFFIGKFFDANRFLYIFCISLYWHEALRGEKKKPLVFFSRLGASISASRRKFPNQKGREIKLKESLWDQGSVWATTAQLYPGRDTFEFGQGHVTKNQPITVLVLTGESLAIDRFHVTSSFSKIQN